MMLTWFLWELYVKKQSGSTTAISESCTVEPRQLYYWIVSWWVSEPSFRKKSEVWLKLLSCYSLIPVVMSLHFQLTTHDQMKRWSDGSISTSLEGLWGYLVILYWHDCFWMLRARRVRGFHWLPLDPSLFFVQCHLVGSSVSVFIRKRDKLYEVLAFDLSSQLQVHVQCHGQGQLGNLWQMSMLHIVFWPGRKECFTERGVKNFRSLNKLEPLKVTEQAFFF